MALGDLIESMLYVFGPFLPFFFAGLVVGGLLTAVLNAGLELMRWPGR